MKRLKISYLILFSYFLLAYTPYERSLKYKPTFGRTHFIIGYEDYDLEFDDASSRHQEKQNYELDDNTPICCDANGTLCSALFAPDHNLRAALRYLIKNEQEKISIAIFAFTDVHVARELQAAHRRGVKIEVLVDPSCLRSQHHKIDLLEQAGIPVYIYKAELSKGIMHNKFALFEKTINNKRLVWTGSFNFTKSGSDVNQENVLVLDDVKIVKQYQNQFERLKERAGKLNAAKIASDKKRFITTIPS